MEIRISRTVMVGVSIQLVSPASGEELLKRPFTSLMSYRVSIQLVSPASGEFG